MVAHPIALRGQAQNLDGWAPLLLLAPGVVVVVVISNPARSQHGVQRKALQPIFALALAMKPSPSMGLYMPEKESSEPSSSNK